LLSAHAKIGRPVDGMDPTFRDWWVPFGTSGYVARYRVDGRRAVILAARHGGESGF
jgi:plasmid stabilization system protein ParE